MPRQNGTGPMGMGPMSGRGMGPCAVPAGRQGGGMIYGRRQGGGRGLGWRRFWGYYPAPSVDKKEETKILSEEAEVLEEELKAVKARLEEIKNKK
ncbi:MAG: DUF5320 domain-containing protein [Parcubacteria group bacterium]